MISCINKDWWWWFASRTCASHVDIDNSQWLRFPCNPQTSKILATAFSCSENFKSSLSLLVSTRRRSKKWLCGDKKKLRTIRDFLVEMRCVDIASSTYVLSPGNSFLRTSLCKNQTSWEMKIFNPPSNFACG